MVFPDSSDMTIVASNIFSQFLKFQAFAEQLTKETSELKVKIESHKRENRRLSTLIDQQKDDAARLTLRLSGTEKQRDDALEALVLQQEIAEELERERKRNQKELAALQNTNSALARQRDEAVRVVVHLRSLISGQTHHVEHLIRSIGSAPELSDYAERVESPEQTEEGQSQSRRGSREILARKASASRLSTYRRSMASRRSSRILGGDANADMESNSSTDKDNRLSRLSMSDVADRYLRDKTDAIADIIRNISDQCAAAVEGLHLAQGAEEMDDLDDMENQGQDGSTVAPSDDGRAQSTRDGSELGEGESSFLNADSRNSIPPTPDLVHNRSSTSMSMVSSSTIPERSSQQYGPGDIPTKIVEDDDETAHETDGMDDRTETGTVSKQASQDLMRPNTTRVVA